MALSGATLQAAERQNIVRLISEDHRPQMGCYGDRLATTPNVDDVARRGLCYTRVWSSAPVCAPARTTLITGVDPTATGSEHMRSMVPTPRGQRTLPQILRDAGYYTSNAVRYWSILGLQIRGSLRSPSIRLRIEAMLGPAGQTSGWLLRGPRRGRTPPWRRQVPFPCCSSMRIPAGIESSRRSAP